MWQCVTIYKTVRTKDYYTSLVNVTSENYNARLFFSLCYCSNDINRWFKFKIQATSKTERMTSSFSGLFLWNLEGKSTGNKIVENGYLQEYKVRQFFCATRKFPNAYSSFHKFGTETYEKCHLMYYRTTFYYKKASTKIRRETWQLTA